MKKILLILILFSPISLFATEKCDSNHRISDIDYKIIEKVVVKKNSEDNNKKNFVLKNKAFDIASLDF